MAAYVLDASLDTPATELSLASCVSAELVVFDSASLSLTMRRRINQPWRYRRHAKKISGVRGLAPVNAGNEESKNSKFSIVLIDPNQNHRSPHSIKSEQHSL